MITSKVGRNGQIVLPSLVRKRLGLEEGHRGAFVVDSDGRTVLEPVTKTLRELRGSVKAKDVEHVKPKTRKRKVKATSSKMSAKTGGKR